MCAANSAGREGWLYEALLAVAMAQQLPGGWHSQVSSTSGETYYVNSETLTSQYEFPTAPTSEYLAKNPAAAANSPALPAGWSTGMPAVPAVPSAQAAGEVKSGVMQKLAERFKSPKAERSQGDTARDTVPIAAPLESVEALLPKEELPDGLKPGMQVTSKIALKLRDGKSLKVGAIGHINGPAATGKPGMVHVHFGKTGDDVDMYPMHFERGLSAEGGAASVSTSGQGSKEQQRKAATRLAAVERGWRDKERAEDQERVGAAATAVHRGRSRTRGRSRRGSRSRSQSRDRSRSRSRSPISLRLSPSRSDRLGDGDSASRAAADNRSVSPTSAEVSPLCVCVCVCVCISLSLSLSQFLFCCAACAWSPVAQRGRQEPQDRIRRRPAGNPRLDRSQRCVWDVGGANR